MALRQGTASEAGRLHRAHYTRRNCVGDWRASEESGRSRRGTGVSAVTDPPL